jgi:DNA-binding CsgD family transcriptional regulator
MVANEVTNFVSGDAAFAINPDGIIISWNLEAEKIFNYAADDALGRRCWKLLSGQDMYGNSYCCERCPILQMASHHESVHSFQIWFRTVSNGWKKFAVNCLTVFGENGDKLLLHICNFAEKGAEYSVNNHATNKPSVNNNRSALTRRELEVLALLSDGQSSREIASLICISHATVRNHIQHILYKLHAHNRLEAVVKAHRMNIV